MKGNFKIYSYRFFMVILIVNFLPMLTAAQLQLHIEGSGELASFQKDLPTGQGGLINLLRGPFTSLGYLGIHPERPSDMEFGTTDGSSGLVTFTILNVPRLTINNIGDFRIAKMLGSNLGQVYASPDGELSKLEGEQVYTVHFAHFRPSDVDGEFVEIVQPIDEVEFVRHQSSEGELSAPLHLPKGAIITKMKAYYINEASDNSFDNTFEICIERARSNANFIFQDRSPWLQLLKGGNLFFTEFGDWVNIATAELEVTPIRMDYSSNYYNVIVRCKDCSDQYIRAVDIVYEF